MIEQKVRELLEEKVNELGVNIDSIVYEKESGNYFLRIVIDSEEGIDLDKCVEVTRLINPMLDDSHIIEDGYTLEVWSKERGE